MGGRGQADAQSRRESEEDGVACNAADYAFMGDQVEVGRMAG